MSPYIQIARPDHWFKNIFLLPGVALVFFVVREIGGDDLLRLAARGKEVRLHGEPFHFSWLGVLLGLVSTCLVASSNYVINEVLDAPSDRKHPEKRNRPVPSGRVKIPVALAEWLLLMVLGVGLGFCINIPFGCLALGLWIMGLLYNIRPVRLKDRPYFDVLSESINNPIRLGLGWYSCMLFDGASAIGAPTASVLLAYWMFGAFLMAMKRFAEYRMIGDPERAAAYRESFRHYDDERLLESLFFYGAFFGMMSGVFIARYQPELVLATPLVSLCIAYYMHIGFKPDSRVQRPEQLYREPKLMVLVTVSFVACTVLLLIDLPEFTHLFAPTIEAHPLAQ